jgi:lipopolysaccharide biosynthesis glycosyltransferase
MQSGVAFYSVCENNPKGSIHFWVLTDHFFSEENKNKLRDTVLPFGNKIDFMIIDDALLGNSANFATSRYPKYVFFRVFMSEVMPVDIDRVLYIDSDIIVRHSLAELWETEMEKVGIAVVRDALEGTIGIYNRLGYSYDYGYFNAGVALMNLSYWRSHHIIDDIMEFMQNHADLIILQDQDILNHVFYNRKKIVNFTYNLQSAHMYKKRFLMLDYPKYKKELDEALVDPTILHFAGDQPWTIECTHPYKDEFLKYKNETVWKDVPLMRKRRTFSQRLMSSNVIRRPLSRMGICSVLNDPYDRSLKLKN